MNTCPSRWQMPVAGRSTMQVDNFLTPSSTALGSVVPFEPFDGTKIVANQNENLPGRAYHTERGGKREKSASLTLIAKNKRTTQRWRISFPPPLTTIRSSLLRKISAKQRGESERSTRPRSKEGCKKTKDCSPCQFPMLNPFFR